MKKLILAIFLLWLLPGLSSAQMLSGPMLGSDGGGVLTDTNCDQALYYPLGTLCQDSDDGKLYKGMGSAVEEIAAATAGGGDVSGPAASTNGELPLFSGTGGKTLKRSNGLSGWPYVTAGVLSVDTAANTRTALGLAIGTDVQAYDADLTTYAGITPSANVQSLLGAADYAAMRTQLGLVIGTNVQAYNAGLASLAGLTEAAGSVVITTAANTYDVVTSASGLKILQNSDGTITWNATTGTGDSVMATSPTLVTPTLGVATATSVNKYTLTAPATGATLTILNGKVFTVNNTLTLAGTDSSVVTFPAASGTVAYAGTMTSGKLCRSNADTKTVDCNAEDPTGLGTITAVGNEITTGPAFTTAVPGRTLTFNNTTSGTVVLQTQTGALGSTVVSLPAVTGTLIAGPANIPITIAGPSAARTVTFPDAAFTAARTDAGQTFTGVNVFTAPTITTSIAPTVAGASTLGTTTYEWGNVYLTDSAVIYGQADQTNTLTSAATGWSSNLLFTSNAGFAAKQGTSGGFVDFYEPSGSGTNKVRLIAPVLAGDLTWTLPTAAAGGTGYLFTSNIAGAMSFTDPATFSVAAGSASIVTVGTLTSGALGTGFTAVTTALGGTGLTSYTGGDTVYYSTGTTLSKLGKGTAYQVYMMNPGATAPAWTSTIGATGTRMITGYFTDLEITNSPTVNGTAISATYLALAGGTMTGRIVGVTPASGGAGYASFNLPHGTAPTTNIQNGDLWTTTSGLYARINGATVGPFGSSTATIAGTVAASADKLITSQGTANTIQAVSAVSVDSSGNISGLGTVSAGAAGFTVDADGDTTVKSITASKSTGVAGDLGLYEANSTDTDTAGFRGPTSLTANTSYRGQFPTARATSDNMVLVWTKTGESGSGTPSDPYIQALAYADLDNYLLLAGGTLTGKLITATNGTAAGLNLTQSSGDPSSPINGDLWITASGMYARVAGNTVGPYATVSGLISDTAYAGSWNAVTDVAPSKNAVYDKIETLMPLAGGTFSGDVTVANGIAIKTDTTNAHTMVIQGYGTGTAYASVITVTNNTAASPALAFPLGGTFGATITPTSNDGAALGTTALMWSDLFLASGSVISFNNGDVTLTHSSNTLTLGGGDLALGSNSLTMTGSIAATGSRVTKGWFTDLESTNAITINGTAITALATTTPGTNVATFLATPSSTNLASALTDETGSGSAVFATGPSLVTPYVKNADTSGGGIRFYEDSDNGTNYTLLKGADAQTSDYTVTLPTVTGTLPVIIGAAAKALDFASTATGACATVIQDDCTNCVGTDVVIFNPNASIKAVTGYVPAATGGFSITAFASSGKVNFEGCNWTAGTVDPGSITVNWMVIR